MGLPCSAQYGLERMNRRHWGWVALGVGVMLVLGGAGVLYRGVMQGAARPAIQLPCRNVVSGCSLPDASLRVRFDQAPQSMKPFLLSVEILNAREVRAGFAMRGMQMGLNQYRLLAKGAGLWQATITLPVCVDGRADWVMTLDVDGRLYQVPFSSN